MYEVENGGTALNMVGETELEKGEDAPMTIAVNAEVCINRLRRDFVCSDI